MRLSPLLALQGVYATNSMALALWFPRIPDVKAALGLDYTVLSYALLGLPAGLMLGFLGASRIVQRLGHRRTCQITGPIFALLMILPALAPTALTLGLLLGLAGLSMSLIEVAMNAKANSLQESLGRRIMSRCHGAWSIGAMLGGLIAGATATLGWSFLTQQMVLETVIAGLAILCATALPSGDVRKPKGKAHLHIPHPALFALCILPFGALIVEGSMFDWSALYVRDILEGTPLEGSILFAVFAIAMGLARLGGDAVTERIGVARVLSLSGVAMVVGVLAIIFGATLETALFGAVFAGIGAANVYPLAMSLSHHAPGQSPEGNVAIIALLSFSVFLLGPPMIGLLADHVGLDRAFLALLPFVLISPILVATKLVDTDPKERS